MGKLLGHMERFCPSQTVSRSFEASTGSAQRRKLVSDVDSLGPMVFVLRATNDVRIRQGADDVVADENDLLLERNTYFKIKVEREAQNYLSVISNDSNTGTLYATLVSEPTTDSDGTSAIGA